MEKGKGKGNGERKGKMIGKNEKGKKVKKGWREKIYASVGNRTRANCLEGNYDTISPRKLVDEGRCYFTS
jgi:hypothetical protein